jgi:cobalt-zinc-cadmium efflux system membrane fusion protein
MENETDPAGGPTPLSIRYQLLTVGGLAALAALALAFVFLDPEKSESASEQHSKPEYFVPSSAQAAAMQLATVGTRDFHTRTLTEGYVAPNGRWEGAGLAGGAGFPVLAGESAELLQAENDLATAAGQLRVAKAVEQRQQKLFQSGGGALKDWQQSQADLTAAMAAFETAQNKLRLMGKTGRDLGVLEMSGQSAAGVAPVAGRIFTVGGPDLVWLVANVREVDAAHVRPGDFAEVRVPALPDKVLHVRISYLSGTIDPATHRLVAAGLYRNADGALKPNMLASFAISDSDNGIAPAVPDSAVIYEGEQARIWVVDGNGRYSLRDISVGRSQDGYVEVLRGVSAGEKVVTGGALFVDPEKTGT